MLPAISCICVTYGRTGRLREAIQSFLDQEYGGEAQLLILNTCPRQCLFLSDTHNDRLRVMNLKERPGSLGEARNMAIGYALHDIIVTLDDDDLFLPDHLATIGAAYDEETNWVWLDKQYWVLSWKVKSITPGSCPLFSFRKQAWQKAGGYPQLTCGEDRSFIAMVTQHCKGKKVSPPKPTFLYCWENGVYHASGLGDDKPGSLPAHVRVAQELNRRLERGLEPSGNVGIEPGYAQGHNPVEIEKEYVKTLPPSPDKPPVCVIELGRYGDVINILPILNHIARVYDKPVLMISKEFANVLDGVSYVEPWPVDLRNDQLNEAIKMAKRKYRFVVNAQIWGRNWNQERTCSAFNLESWNNCGFAHKFDDPHWLPVFDQRDQERELALSVKVNPNCKPMILVNVTHSASSPYPQGQELLAQIRSWAGEDLLVVDLGQLRFERVYDALALMALARVLISIDTALLHLAAASGIPIVALVNPQPWLGSRVRGNVWMTMNYNVANTEAGRAQIRHAVLNERARREPLLIDTTSQPPKRHIVHAVERHDEQSPKDLRRKQMAWKSWDSLYNNGIIPCHVSDYPRNALSIGDVRPLPYLKDVLKAAMDMAHEDTDIIMFTNDDVVLHPELPSLVEMHVALYDACCAQRCDFSGTPRLGDPSAMAQALAPHMGRDLFAFTKGWLKTNWDEIGDFILGASEWDLAMACMIRSKFGIESTRQNLELCIHPAELPRGYVLHQVHPARWYQPGNVDSAPSQKHNRKLFFEWAKLHAPTIKFSENLTI